MSQHHTHALEKIVAAYGSIGAVLPRLSRYNAAFPDNRDFQQILGYLFEDILEFHSRAYRILKQPGELS